MGKGVTKAVENVNSIIAPALVGKDPTDQKAYKKLCLKFHPDKAGGRSEADKEAAQKRFLEVQKAYEVLSDAQLRRTFDAERSRASRSGFGLGGVGRYGSSFSFGNDEDLFAAFYGRATSRASSRR